MGNKLHMEVEEGGAIVVAVDYSSGVHYVEWALTWVRTGEVRVLKYGSAWEFEYEIADHQGNIRTTLGLLQDTEVYLAILEEERQAEEQADFDNMTTLYFGYRCRWNSPQNACVKDRISLY